MERFCVILSIAVLICTSFSLPSEEAGDVDIRFCEYNGEWNKSYGGTEDDWAYEILPPDNGYVVEGITASYGAGKSDIWLIRLDENGNEMWNKTYGGKDLEYAFDIISVEDGYIIAGQTFSFSRGFGDGWIIKIDENGKEIWNKTYGGKEDEYGGILLEADDGYIILGETSSYGKGGLDIWLIKIDENGNEIWNITFGSEGDDYCGGNGAICKAGDGYIFVASRDASFPSKGDLWIVKVDRDGKEEWERVLGEAFFDYGTAIKEAGEGYIVAGITSSFGAGKTDAWVLRIFPPPFSITISGGLGIKIIIGNNGMEEIRNMEWSVEMEGLIFFGATSSGSIDKLSPGEEYMIRMLPFGIGSGRLTIRLGEFSKNIDFFIIGPFVSIK